MPGNTVPSLCKMDYNRVSSEKDYSADSFADNPLQIMAGIFLLLLLTITSLFICFWIRFDLDFWEWVVEIDWYTYWRATYFVMAAMFLKAGLLCLGLYSISISSGRLLLFSSFFHPVAFALHLASSAVICTYGVEESDVLRDELHEVFLTLVHRWDIDHRASRILRQIMEYVGCCGADGGDDFFDVHKPIPFQCRDPITGNEWPNGCEQQMGTWLEAWTCTLAGISIFLCLADIVLPVVYMKMRKSLFQDSQGHSCD